MTASAVRLRDIAPLSELFLSVGNNGASNKNQA